jgi:TolB-like protein
MKQGRRFLVTGEVIGGSEWGSKGYKRRDIEPQKVAKELGVETLVTGRVLQRGDALSVGAELVDAFSTLLAPQTFVA